MAALLAAAVAGCSPDDILDVTDPDIIDPKDVNSPAGAEGLRRGTLRRLNEATSGDESFFLFGGLMADEWRSGDTFTQRDQTDQRNVVPSNANVDLAYRDIHQARLSAEQTISALEEFAPDAPAWNLGQMNFVAGYTEVLLAEHFCGAVPFSDIVDGQAEYGLSLSRDDVLARAIAHFDEALASATGTPVSEADRVKFSAQVGKGRALLNLGRFPEAATAVAGVPTTFEFLMTHASTTEENVIWQLNNSNRRYTVANLDGTSGLNFVTAADPRVRTTPGGNTRSFDTVTPLFRQQVWPVRESSVAIVDGIEARLIEAEAALRAGNAVTWLTTLNALRANTALYACPTGLSACTPPAPLAPLVDPVTDVARQNLHFRERAFWLFSTGHRLGDLRRLVSQYGRGPETVFPTGNFHKGGTYGLQVNFPIPQDEENNPNYKPAECSTTTAA
ncbi:MAG: hypothetical protein ACREON_11410 [Gemmatimonadaceae bacterium]